MIVADKRVLKANLAKGSIAVQYKLITLYVNNLSTLGTNAALIAVMTLVGLIETEYPMEGFIPDGVFSVVFYFLCLLAWIYSLLAYSEAATSVICPGPGVPAASPPRAGRQPTTNGSGLARCGWISCLDSP